MDWLFTYADPTIDWDYAIITLVVRFIGVFIVMGVMQVAMQISSSIVQRIEARGSKATATAALVATPAADDAVVSSLSLAPAAKGLDDLTAAAIGLALALETRSVPSAIASGSTASPWAAAGRNQQLRRQPR